MLDKEPLWYPSREPFPYNPAVTDRQLWAVGMIVVQWSMTEFIIDNHIRKLIANDQQLTEQLNAARRFQQMADLWESQIKINVQESLRAEALELVRRARDLNSQRDEVIHRAWGGGIQGGSWATENYETTDPAILRKTGDKFKTKSEDARATLHWRLTFNRLRQMAREMAALNAAMLQAFLHDSAPSLSGPHPE